MVIGIFKAESTREVKNNPFYGDYQVKEEVSKTIVNEKYTGLVPPKNGIKITFENADCREVTFTIGKYFFTGVRKSEYDEDSEFSATFDNAGHIYEVCVDCNGDLISLDEWYDRGDFEDGNEPFYHHIKTNVDELLEYELIDM